MEDSDDNVAINVCVRCPCCKHKLNLEKRADKKRAKMAASKLKFNHFCHDHHHSGEVLGDNQ